MQRRVLKYSLVALSLCLIAGITYPLLSSLSPASYMREERFTRIDVSQLKPGEVTVRKWSDQAIVVLYRTDKHMRDISALKEHRRFSTINTLVPEPEGLIDEYRSLKLKYFVAYSLPGSKKQCSAQYSDHGDNFNFITEFEIDSGFMEQCRGAWYDTAGHALNRGWPDTYDLSIPPHKYLNETLIEIGPIPTDPNQSFGILSKRSLR